MAESPYGEIRELLWRVLALCQVPEVGFEPTTSRLWVLPFFGEAGTLGQAELPRHKYAWISYAIKWFAQNYIL